jgi:hypothetical protein
MPTYLYDVFQKRQAFMGLPVPFKSKDFECDISYPKGMCPKCEDAFEHTFNLNLNEFYTEKDIDEMVAGVAKVAEFYIK